MRSRLANISFATVLASAMGTATFALVVYAVLAAELIAEFGVARWQIGALVTANSLIGAVASPVVGTITDRLGARRATLTTIGISVVALGGIAASPGYGVLILAALVGGIAQSFANPSTNKLISLHVEPGARGVITGIKQSGVQFGTFLAGLLLPVLTRAFGWRWAVGVFVIVAGAAWLLARSTLPSDPGSPERGSSVAEAAPMPALIYRLTVYGFLLGAAGTAIFTYLPLFAEESLGFSGELAGLAVAVSGLMGIVARIAWGRIAEHHLGAERSLSVIALLAVVGAVLLAASPSASVLVWPAVIFTAWSASAWNTVGMLAIIQSLPPSRAGRGSGVVLLGFLAGLGVGAPIFGWSVDRWGTYAASWLVVAVVFGAGGLVLRGSPAGLRP